METNGLSYGVISTLPGSRALKSGDLEAFSKILGNSWGDKYGGLPDVLDERFHSGELFFDAYHQERPIGLLETISLSLEEPPKNIPSKLLEEISRNLGKSIGQLTQKEIDAAYICSQLQDYSNVTNFGKWRPPAKNPNVLLFVDLTVPEEHRGGRYFPPLSTGLVNLPKFLLSRDQDAEKQLGYLPKEKVQELKSLKENVPQLKFWKWAVTYTPDHDPIRNFHLRQYAFDTGKVLKNARPGFAPNGKTQFSDVRPTCYMAPEFAAQSGYMFK